MIPNLDLFYILNLRDQTREENANQVDHYVDCCFEIMISFVLISGAPFVQTTNFSCHFAGSGPYVVIDNRTNKEEDNAREESSDGGGNVIFILYSLQETRLNHVSFHFTTYFRMLITILPCNCAFSHSGDGESNEPSDSENQDSGEKDDLVTPKRLKPLRKHSILC